MTSWTLFDTTLVASLLLGLAMLAASLFTGRPARAPRATPATDLPPPVVARREGVEHHVTRYPVLGPHPELYKQMEAWNHAESLTARRHIRDAMVKQMERVEQDECRDDGGEGRRFRER